MVSQYACRADVLNRANSPFSDAKGRRATISIDSRGEAESMDV